MARKAETEEGASSRWRVVLWTSLLELEGGPGAFSGESG